MKNKIKIFSTKIEFLRIKDVTEKGRKGRNKKRDKILVHKSLG